MGRDGRFFFPSGSASEKLALKVPSGFDEKAHIFCGRRVVDAEDGSPKRNRAPGNQQFENLLTFPRLI